MISIHHFDTSFVTINLRLFINLNIALPGIIQKYFHEQNFQTSLFSFPRTEHYFSVETIKVDILN